MHARERVPAAEGAAVKLRVGDRLVRPMDGVPWLNHHGVVIGKNRVIHLQDVENATLYRDVAVAAGMDAYGHAAVRVTTPFSFFKGHPLRVDRRPVDPRAVVARARAAQAQRRVPYSAMFANCESFARGVQDGQARSDQTQAMVEGLAAFALGCWLGW